VKASSIIEKLKQTRILQNKVIISETPVCDVLRHIEERKREKALYFYFLFLVTQRI